MSSKKVVKKVEKKQGKVLHSSEIHKLIDVWRDNVDALRANSKNSHIYKKMCEELKDYGIELTPNEVMNRIHNLARRYRKEKNMMGPSGGTRSTWAYYETINSFLHKYKQNNMIKLMDESVVPDKDDSGNKEMKQNEEDWNGEAEATENMETDNFDVEYLEEDSDYCMMYTQSSSAQSPLLSTSQECLNNDESTSSSAYSLKPSAIPSTSGERSATPLSSGRPSATPSSSKNGAKFAPPKRGKKNIQERLLDLAERENEKFESFMTESLECEHQIIELMKKNNELLEKVVDKI